MARQTVLLATLLVSALSPSVLNIFLAFVTAGGREKGRLLLANEPHITAPAQTSNQNLQEHNHDDNNSKMLVQEGDSIYTRGEWDAAPVVIEEPFRLIFFTSAKVGCTVWKQLFRRMMGYSDWRVENVNYLPWNPATNGLKYLYDYNTTEATRMMTSPDWTRAIFVRDPKERFLSAYLDKAVRHPYFLKQQCCRNNNNDSYDLYDDECVGKLPAAKASPAGLLALGCDNAHWRPQSRRIMESKYWKTINFVGHMETVAQDAERLLRRIGAWERYGASGWGLRASGGEDDPHNDDNMRIFQSSTSVGRQHATSAASRLQSYLTPKLERDLDEYYADDYAHPVLNLTRIQYVVQS